MSIRIRKRGDKYSYGFEAGKIDGKRRRVEKGGYTTKADAYEAGIKAYTDWKHGGVGITNESMLLDDFIKLWLDKICKPNMKPSSLRGYRNALNRLTDVLRSQRIQDITPAMLDGFLRDLAARGLAYATLRHQLTIMREMFSYAVYPAQLIGANPAACIKPPKTNRRQVIERKIISYEEFKALIDKYPRGTFWRVPLFILYYTGVRAGELCGLTWDDVDFQHATITINKQLQYEGRDGIYLSTPKTKSSVRVIPISAMLIDELKAWKALQAAQEAKKGPTYIYTYADGENVIHRQSKALEAPSEWKRIRFICTHPSGTPLQKPAIYFTLRHLGYNAHSFRHTHATMLIEAGAPAKGVAARLGHASTNITMNLYTHNTKNMQKYTEQAFERFVDKI